MNCKAGLWDSNFCRDLERKMAIWAELSNLTEGLWTMHEVIHR